MTVGNIVSRHRELILYAVIGATGALLDFFVYLLLVGQLGIDPVMATMLSVSVGIINNFVLNAFLNFRVRTRLWMRFISFYTIGLIGVALSALIIWIFTDVVDIGGFWAKVVSIPPTVIGQFIANKYITFARGAKTLQESEDQDVPGTE